ncbi:MAG: alkaline phosphatase family protein [Pseudomonadota bacterium]
MSKKVCLVIMDGAGYESVLSECGYLEGCVSLGDARRWKMKTATPSLSVPMYETIHTGLWPHRHGIVANESVRTSDHPNIFSLSRAAGLRTAAVAHQFFHRLYVGTPWDPLRSIEHEDENTDIQFARFYSMEGYGPSNAVVPAEIDLCAQTTLLMEHHQPHYVLHHTSSVDTLGHTYGGHSREYRHQIWQTDNALSRALPVWRELGYDVIVTADHGITEDHWHGGTSAMATEVPFYLFSGAQGPEEDVVLSQLGIAASVLMLLGVDVPRDMACGDGFLLDV